MPAARRPATGCRRVEGPSGIELIMAAADTAVQASVRASYTAFERIMADWQRQLIAWRCGLSPELRKRYGAPANWNCRDLKFFVNRVGFDQLGPERAKVLNAVDTRLKLPVDQVDAVIAAGRDALRANPTFRDFLKGIGGPARRRRLTAEPAEPPSTPVAVRCRTRPRRPSRRSTRRSSRPLSSPMASAAARSRPCFLITGAAAGAVRNFCNALASVCALAPAGTPLENTVMFWTSAGIGPRKSMPASWINSLTCWKPISASPFRIRDATGTPGVVTFALALIWSAMPIFSNRLCEIDAARSGRIADRFRGQQRLLEVVAGFEHRAWARRP